MPIYEYECEKCLRRFEMKRHFGEDGASPCPHCGSMARRLFSPVPIVFKGSGFYVTDSRKNSDHGADEAKRLMDECKPKTEPAKKENK
ncbi:MAG: FmdB family zinc ribbon protein [Dehalococcoides mccartyi]|uniref:FmdB family zinc ribbon protein n=1 Tax=Dehalococcoides mccartyi TaxID=61435 RepID=UPI0030F6F0A3